MDVAGCTALITGASSGIGAAIAEAFAREGVRLGLCARREAELEAVADRCRSLGAHVEWWSVDLSDLDATIRFAARADEELGGIDILVNNAGMPKRRTVTALRLDEIDDVIALNYLSPVRLIHVLLPRMIDRARPAAIVNMSSVAARLAPAGEASYAASKAALTAFSESLAVEIWDSNVQVHVVNPGVIDTPLFELPDNDPMYAVVEARPAALVADAILDQLRVGTFEIYVPDEFGQFALGKAANLQPYLEGSAAYYRSMTQQD